MKESPFSFDFNDKAKNKKQEHENKGVFEEKNNEQSNFYT